MKLRNKKTGEVWEVPKGRNLASQEDDVSFWVEKDNEGRLFCYKSLAELNAEWEDYASKEPLIKDEKVRKAVRAWAEALGLQEVYCASNGYEIYGGVDDYVIQFEGEPFPFADGNKVYSIAELCGEEEE